MPWCSSRFVLFVVAGCAAEVQFVGDGVPGSVVWGHVIKFEQVPSSAINAGPVAFGDDPFLACGGMTTAPSGGVDRAVSGVVYEGAYERFGGCGFYQAARDRGSVVEVASSARTCTITSVSIVPAVRVRTCSKASQCCCATLGPPTHAVLVTAGDGSAAAHDNGGDHRYQHAGQQRWQPQGEGDHSVRVGAPPHRPQPPLTCCRFFGGSVVVEPHSQRSSELPGRHPRSNSDKFGFDIGVGYPGTGTNLGIRQTTRCERLTDNRKLL